MPYVSRDAQGNITGVYAQPQPGYAEEYVEDATAPEPAPLPEPQLYAVALLAVADGEITGIDVASKFSAAMWLDVGIYYIFFAETQPDTSYLAKAYDAAGGFNIAVTERGTDYLALAASDANGQPADPSEISIEIIRTL